MSSPITIVSGLPRSGTSMMMRMIVAAGVPPLTDNLRTADEDNPHGYFEFEPVKKTKQDPSWLKQAEGKVVKMVHLLLPELPAGAGAHRIVMMHRDIDEVIASQAKMLQRAGKPSADAQMLKRVYAAQMEAVRKWIASTPGVRSVEVSYNRMLADPKGEARRVAEFLDLPAAAEQMAAAVDPGLYRNRKV